MAILWTPALETGHPNIDSEHREVIRHLAAIEAAIESSAGSESVVALVTTLQEYVVGHFAREEAYMLRIHCPAYEASCRAHADFTRKFASWIPALRNDNVSSPVARKIHNETTTWIQDHIITVDCRMRGCVSAPSRSPGS